MTSWQGGREQLNKASAIVFGIFGIFTLLDASEASEQPPPILQEPDSAETLGTLLWLSAHSLEIGYFSKTAGVALSRVPCSFYLGRRYAAERRYGAKEAIVQSAYHPQRWNQRSLLRV